MVKSDESLNLDTAVAAVALAEALQAYYTRPRQEELPATVRARLRRYVEVRERVPITTETRRH